MSSRVLRGLLVIAILALALGLRVNYVQTTPYKAVNDAGTYNRLASMVAQHGDYATGSAPGSGAAGSRGPTAYFPPGFPYVLALTDILDGHQSGHRAAIAGERTAMALIGTVSVGLLGLVALEACGGLVALLAMLLAAVYPVMIALSGTLVAENVIVALELAAAWAALRAWRSRRPLAWLAGAGALTGLATLTHQNSVLLLIPLAFAAVSAGGALPGSVGRTPRETSAPPRSGSSKVSGRRLAGGVAVLVAATVVVIAPWTIRNANELHAFVPVSTETGITLVGTYNRESASNTAVPYKWRFVIKLPEDHTLLSHVGQLDEVTLSDRLQSQALDYISAHPSAPLQAAYHNLLRMIELEGSDAWHASAAAVGLSVPTARRGVIGFWIVAVLALAGLVTRAARGAPRWLWGFPVLMALSVVFINVETPRFREPVDPFLLLLAACSLGAVLKRAGHLAGWGPGQRGSGLRNPGLDPRGRSAARAG